MKPHLDESLNDFYIRRWHEQHESLNDFYIRRWREMHARSESGLAEKAAKH